MHNIDETQAKIEILEWQLNDMKEQLAISDQHLNNAMDTIAEQDFYIESLEQVIALRIMNDWK